LEGGDGLRAHLAVDLEGAGDGEVTGGLGAGLALGLLRGRGGLLGRSLLLLLLRLLLLLLGLLGEAVLVAVVGDAVTVAAPVALGLGALALGGAVRLLVGLAGLGSLLLLLGGLLLRGLVLLLGRGGARGVGAAGERAAAVGPRARALALQDALADRDLLALRGLVGGGGVLGAAVALPGLLRELQAAVVAVAGVDGPVAAGLAGGDLVPAGGGRGGGGRRGDHAGGDHGAAGDGDGRAAQAAAEGGSAGGALSVRAVLGQGDVLSRCGRSAA